MSFARCLTTQQHPTSTMLPWAFSRVLAASRSAWPKPVTTRRSFANEIPPLNWFSQDISRTFHSLEILDSSARSEHQELCVRVFLVRT